MENVVDPPMKKLHRKAQVSQILGHAAVPTTDSLSR